MQEVCYRVGLNIVLSHTEFCLSNPFVRTLSSRLGFNAPRLCLSVTYVAVDASRRLRETSKQWLPFWSADGTLELSLNLDVGRGGTNTHGKPFQTGIFFRPDNTFFMAALGRSPYCTTAVLLIYDLSTRASYNR